MKGSDYLIILILVIGLGALGFLFSQQDKTPQEIFSDISEKVTGSSVNENNGDNLMSEESPGNQSSTPAAYVPPTQNPPTTSSGNQPQSEENKIYNAGTFSFKYKPSATVDILTNAGQTIYQVSKVEEVSEMIKIVNTSEFNIAEHCGDLPVLTTTINGKTFRYCQSEAEPATTYVYTKGDKTLVLMTQGSIGSSYSYIDPGSLEII